MKDKRPLYLQIAESVRQDLLEGRLRPGDALPTVREMAEKWKCTPGTVQQAYKELTREGIAVSRPGQGTRIGSAPVEPEQRDAAAPGDRGAPGRGVPAGDAVGRLHDRGDRERVPREPGPLAGGDHRKPGRARRRVCASPAATTRRSRSWPPASASCAAARCSQLRRQPGRADRPGRGQGGHRRQPPVG